MTDKSIIGYYKYPGSAEVEIKTDLKDEYKLTSYAYYLNMPRNQTAAEWTIKLNCEDEDTKLADNEPKFKCTYKVVTFGATSLFLYGYGDTQVEALEDCINKFDMIQKEHNPIYKSNITDEEENTSNEENL